MDEKLLLEHEKTVAQVKLSIAMNGLRNKIPPEYILALVEGVSVEPKAEEPKVEKSKVIEEKVTCVSDDIELAMVSGVEIDYPRFVTISKKKVDVGKVISLKKAGWENKAIAEEFGVDAQGISTLLYKVRKRGIEV